MGYVHPEALVGTDWLAANLGNPRLRVVDASFTLPGITPTARENYHRRHIPGASRTCLTPWHARLTRTR